MEVVGVLVSTRLERFWEFLEVLEYGYQKRLKVVIEES